MNDFDENISKKDYIDIQIGLWKHFHEYVDSLETKQQKIISIIATVITALLAISIWQNILLVYYCVPVVLLLLFNYHSSVARSIAILNGYISFLEKEINSNFSKPTFIWSSKYAGKFLINNIPQTMSKVLAIFLSLGACVFIAMQIIKLEFYLLIAIIFIVFLLIALFVTIVGYLLNDKTKTNSLNFALQLYLNTQDDNELAKDDTSKIMNIYSNSVSINHSKRIPFFIATSVSMISVIISIVVFFTKNDIKLVLMNLNWVSILGGLIGVIGTFIVSLVFNKALKKSTGKPKIELNKVWFCNLKGTEIRKQEIQNVSSEISGRCGNTLNNCFDDQGILTDIINYGAQNRSSLFEFKVSKSTITNINLYAIHILFKNNSPHFAKNVFCPDDDISREVDLLTNASSRCYINLSKFDKKVNNISIKYSSESGLDLSTTFTVLNKSDENHYHYIVKFP